MNNNARRIWVMAVCVAVALLLTASSARAQDPETTSALEDWQRQELQSLVEVVGAALRGQLVATEKPFVFKPDFLKGTDGNTYVPFTLTIDSSKVTASSVAMYLFVTAHVDQPPATPPAADDNDDEEALPEAAFEDAYFADVSPTSDEPLHLSRAFTAPGGTYDVYVALRDSAGGAPDEDIQPASTVMMLHEELTIPNLWTPELQTSTVIVADVVEPLDAPLTPEQQILSPYTLGATRILPKHDLVFGKQEELSLIFLVYNPGLQDGSKPDVTIEYTFHQRTAEGEEYFNKTNPQQFNGQTLPPAFDLTLGHQIVAGQSVPLTLFPPGDYRLEITVTDNISGSAVTRDLNFTVEEA